MRNKVKLPVWVVITFIMAACMLISAAVTAYVTNKTVEWTLKSIIMQSQTETGKYPDWFIEWQNTVYLQEDAER